jgi:deoxycytidine triphosphate deaminase
MRVLQGREIAELLGGFIHLPKQVGSSSVILTVKAVERLVGPGALDFGGGERKPAETEPLEPEKERPEEPYGWWELGRGRYRLTYNESGSVREGHVGFLLPWREALESGLLHPTVFLPPGSSVPSVVVAVGAVGLRIKQNARVSELVFLRLEP